MCLETELLRATVSRNLVGVIEIPEQRVPASLLIAPQIR